MLMQLDGPGLAPLSGGKAAYLVVLLHGVAANGNDLISLGSAWRKILPKAEFIAPRFVGLAKLFAIPPEKGAYTIIYLASSTGQYFYKCRPIAPSRAARDDRDALLLWERSAGLASLKV